MSSSFYRLAFIPAGIAVAWFGNECAGAYRKVRIVAKYIAHRKGYRFDQYPKDDPLATWTPPLLAALTGGAVFFGSKALMDRILLSSRVDQSRLFDRLSASDVARAKLTPARLWKLVGPATATRSSWRDLGRIHGLAMLSGGLALLWGVCIAPVAHVEAECMFAPRGAALTDASRTGKLQRNGAGGQSGSRGGSAGGGMSDADMQALAALPQLSPVAPTPAPQAAPPAAAGH